MRKREASRERVPNVIIETKQLNNFRKMLKQQRQIAHTFADTHR